MADLTIALTPGYTFTQGELVTNDKLNSLSNPTVILTGTLGATTIGDGSITTIKLAAGILSNDTAGHGKMADGYISANAEGQAKMAAGYFSANATGRAYMAAGYFSADATGQGKFANGFLTADAAGLLLMADGYLSANAGGQLKMANAYVTAAKIAAGVIVPPVAAVHRNVVTKNNGATPLAKVDVTADELMLLDTNNIGQRAAAVNLTADITVSQNLNGRDTAVAEAASTWYYIWIISDGTNIRSVLSISSATAAGTAQVETNLRANANFVGYSAKAMVGMVYNDAGSNFVTFRGQDREVYINETAVLTGGNSAAYLQVVNIVVIPPVAKTMMGTMGSTANASCGISIAGNINGLGAVTFISASSGANGPLGTFYLAGFYKVPLETAQTFYYLTTTAGTFTVKASGWTW